MHLRQCDAQRAQSEEKFKILLVAALKELYNLPVQLIDSELQM